MSCRLLSKCVPIQSDICFIRGVVYKVTCLVCDATYIGSTIRRVHDRIREHMKSSSSSVYKHLKNNCQNSTISVSILDKERDPVNLRLLEALHIKRNKPQINSREECSELDGLLF